MTRQHKSTWQRHERHVAAAVGGARTGNTGTAGADVVTDSWSIECKSTKRLPAKVVAALQQAERTATGGRVAVAVLHEVGRRHDDDLVVLRWRDFADLLIGNHEDDRDTARRGASGLRWQMPQTQSWRYWRLTSPTAPTNKRRCTRTLQGCGGSDRVTAWRQSERVRAWN